MTAPKRLNARPAAIHPSRRRAPARNAEVRSNSDNDRYDARPKIKNGSAFSHETGVRAAKTVTPALANSKWASFRPLKSNRLITASVANASDLLQTALSKLPRSGKLRGISPIAKPGMMYLEVATLKSTRPPGSGDLVQNLARHSIPGFALISPGQSR
jgi:hypothetical protein